MKGTHAIGITGGIGSGKSVVSRVLRCNGFIVYDCDSEAKRIMTQDEKVKTQLQAGIGCEIYSEQGELNRKLLAQMLFNDLKVRTFVNEIVHCAVFEDIKSRLSLSKAEFFIESAILYSSGLWELCEAIWMVTAPEEERMKRVAHRDNLSAAEIKKRMETQEKEFSGLKDRMNRENCHDSKEGKKSVCEKVIILENDMHDPLLLRILELSNKEIENQQTYKIPC